MKQNEKNNKITSLHIRMPYDIWDFVYKISYEQKISKNDVVLYCIEKYKKRFEKKLTKDSDMVS